jgi:GGDEF domain-containing protein
VSRTDDSELILARADLAMREAKALGRARWARSASPVS